MAAALIGAGTGLVTPLGFAALATSTPPERPGQTMGAAELGREIGGAGEPLLVTALAHHRRTHLGLRGPAADPAHRTGPHPAEGPPRGGHSQGVAGCTCGAVERKPDRGSALASPVGADRSPHGGLTNR
jgi:hypothetical protein